MSLFKARDWWATYAGSDEEFDQGCLCVANIDNNSSHFGKLADDFALFIDQEARDRWTKEYHCRIFRKSWLEVNINRYCFLFVFLYQLYVQRLCCVFFASRFLDHHTGTEIQLS